MDKAASKPKKKRARTPKKPPPDPIPTASKLATVLLLRCDDAQVDDLAEPVHVYDIGKPIGAVLYRRLTKPNTDRS